MGVAIYFIGFFIEEPTARWNFSTFANSCKNAFLTGGLFVFPSSGICYRYKKINISSSYNREFSYFNINEKSVREILGKSATTRIISNQFLRQKNWSHRLQLGIDYAIDENNLINLYGFFNLYSHEHDGFVEIKATDYSDSIRQNWYSDKDDTDINRSLFYSLFYKHYFKNNPHSEITLDLGFFDFKAENATIYNGNSEDGFFNHRENKVKPGINSTSIKIDFTSPVSKKIKLTTGVKTKFQTLHDRQSANFKNNENNYAAYGMFNLNLRKYDINLGLRIEYSVFEKMENSNNQYLSKTRMPK